MRTRLCLGLVVVIVLSLGAGTITTDPAQALIPTPTQVITDPANWTKVWALVRAQATEVQTATQGMGSGGKRAVTTARIAGGGYPALGTLGTIALTAGAFAIGWKIGRTLDTRYLHWSGDYGTTLKSEAQGTVNYFNNALVRWQYVAAGTTVNGFLVGTSGMYADYSECNSASPGCTPSGTFMAINVVTAPSCSGNGNVGAVCANLTQAISVVPGATFILNQPGTFTAIYMSEANWNANMNINLDEPWIAQTPTNETTTGYVIPSDPGTDSATATAIRSALLSGDNATDLEVAEAVAPGSSELEVGTIVLPAPEPNETVVAYRQRLRELGWLGTATTATALDDSESPAFGPGSPRELRIRPGETTEEIVRMPGWAPVGYAGPSLEDWPDNPAQFAPGDPIEFTPNVGTATAVDPTTALAPPGLDPAIGSSECEPFEGAEIDLHPLLDLTHGAKFPFGMFTWATDAFAIFDVAPVAPSAHFEFPEIGSEDGPVGSFAVPGGGDYDVELSAFDDHMATIRGLLSFALWIGSIWYAASTFLGIKFGGNPGDAVDEGIPHH